MRTHINDRLIGVLEHMSAHPTPAPVHEIAAAVAECRGRHTVTETLLRSLAAEHTPLVHQLPDATWQIVPDRWVVRLVARVIGPSDEDNWVERTYTGLTRATSSRLRDRVH